MNNVKKKMRLKRVTKLNKFNISLIAVSLVLLSFLVFKISADDINILALTELNKTGDYKEAISNDNSGVLSSNGIDVSINKNNNDLLNKSEAIKVTAYSKEGIKRIELVIYDALNSKIVNSNYYNDNDSNLDKSVVLSINAPAVPINRLLLRIKVLSNTSSADFERTFTMSDSMLSIYAKDLSNNMIQGATLEFYADSSYSSVPVKSLSYELSEGSKVVQSGSYKLYDDSFFITEDGTISYKSGYQKEGTGNFTNVYNDSRLTCDIKIPSKQTKMKLKIEAVDILGKKAIKEQDFNVKNANITFKVDGNSGSVKVGTKINCRAVNSDSSSNFGISKLEAVFYDEKELILSKDYSLSPYSYGSGALEVDAAVPDGHENVSLRLIATDAAGNKKEYGPIKYKVSYNEFEAEPIFRLSSEPKLMGSSEIVAVTSNSGIAFTELSVKITDSEGNIIKDSDGTLKISQISSAVGKETLEVEIDYPETSKDIVYFIFSARDVHGNKYDGGNDFYSMSSTYKKGPISIYSNKINISVTPETGLINSNTNLKVVSKVDIVSNPIKKMEYIYYNDRIDSEPLSNDFNINNGQVQVAYCQLGTEAKEVKVKVERDSTNNKIIKVTPIVDNLIKDGYTLYVTRPQSNRYYFTMIGHYEKKTNKNDLDIVSDYSYFDTETKKEVLGHGVINSSGIVSKAEIKGPEKNCSNIKLMVKVTDKQGKTKTSYFNYYQNEKNVEIMSIPNSGSVYTNGYIKAIAKGDGSSSSVRNLYYEIVCGGNIIESKSINDINHKGEIEADIIVPESAKDKQIEIRYQVIDDDNNYHAKQYLYNVIEGTSKNDFESLVSNIDPNDKNYEFVAGRLAGGINEYVIEYKDVNGKDQTAVINKQVANLSNYFYTNVKELEMLSITQINNALVKNNYAKVLNLNDVKKIYVRLNLYFTNTCLDITKNEYVDITRKVVVTLNDSNYKKIKNRSLDLGNGASINDILDLDMTGEILKKAQNQEVISLNLNNLGPNDSINKVYNPDKLASSNLKAKEQTAQIKFNDSYINNKLVLEPSDLTNGKAFTITPETITNDAHIVINRYVLENYSVKLLDISVHKNHTYEVNNETGEIIEHCSSDCIIKPEQKTITMYYSSQGENKVAKQNVSMTYSYKYMGADGEWKDADSSDTPLYNEEGKIQIKIVASYEAPSLMNIIQNEELAKNPSSDFSVQMDSNYPNDGEIKSFEVSSDTRWVKLTGEYISDEVGPKVKINMTKYENAFYYNENKGRYERSSDRGNQIKVTVSDIVPLKDIKVSFKKETESNYSSAKTLHTFTNEENVLSKEVVIDLPSDVLTNGGLVEVKIVASNYNNETSSGKVNVTGSSGLKVLKLFINTAVGVEPLPLVGGKSLSLIETGGTINEQVANQIGEGKSYDGNTPSLKVTKVYDNKWTYETGMYNVSQMPLYYNSINDTIGLGYRVSFSIDLAGYGTDYFKKSDKQYKDMLIANMKFFARDSQSTYAEVIPYEENNGTYTVYSYQSKVRQLRMEANPNTNNEDASGLNNIKINGNTVTWNFSYYIPTTTKFKYKNDTSGNFIDPNEILVQMDLEAYKYYSMNPDTNEFIKDGSNKDSRHLYSLRENRWNKELDLMPAKTVTTKSAKVKLKDKFVTNKGLVFWYDVAKNATFDLNGQRYN